ncbi:MAG TPA: AraC family transcriptional regulator ligand-binding domain-containing protein [Nevskiaceae bacterium]|nr:AraC family transcriptional regulator ligand-binding domain-containing protein [Nevskiaceae bacterium]
MSARPELVPFITLPNWIKAAAACGFNIQQVFEEVGIATDLMHVETATIERHQLERLMALCVARSQGRHFPFALAETFAFEYLPDLETFLTTSPTPREAIKIFAWVRAFINPMLDVQLVEQGERARLVLRFLGLPSGTVPRPWFAEALFAAVLRFGRRLVGEQGRFDRLCFRHPPPPHAGAYAEYFQTEIAFDQPEYALEFERALLDRPLASGFPALHEQARARMEQRLPTGLAASGWVARLEQRLSAEPALLGLGLEGLAQRLGLHPRTLQRRLQAEGERYDQVQGRVRYRLALQALEKADADLETLSEQLGFSDRRSFTRAFSRWSGGLTPSEFRARRRAS